VNSLSSSPKLRINPNWQKAAQSLINSIAVLDSDDERMDFLEDLCDGLGKNLYPAFLHMLYHVEKAGTLRAQELVVKTFVGCLMSGRLPSGETDAWGAAKQNPNRQSSGDGFSHQRRLGPIEYLCAWQLQSQGSGELNRQQFTEAMSSLLRLISAEPRAATLYRQHIELQLSDPVGGAFNQLTRNALQSLIDNWANKLPPHSVAERCLDTTKPGSVLEQVAQLQKV